MFKRTPVEKNLHDYTEARLSAYIDGRLSEDERAVVRKHLQTCDRCQASLKSLGWTINLFKQVPAPALPRQFTLPVPAPKSVPERTTPGWFGWGLRAGAVVAATAFIIVITVNLLTRQSAAPSQLNVALATQAPTGAADTSAAAAPPAPAATSAPAPTNEIPTLEPPPTEAAPVAPVPTESNLRQLAPASPTPPQVVSKATRVTPTPPCSACGGGSSENGVGTPRTFSAQALPSSETPITGRVTTNELVVRAGPGRSFAQVGVVHFRDRLEVFARDEASKWLQIVYPLKADSSERGWVGAGFVNTQQPISSLPVVGTGTPTPTETPIPTYTPTPTETPLPTETPPYSE